MEVKGGFLDGLVLELDPHFNCIIGEPGTGKSTAFEVLRFVLGDRGASSEKVAFGLKTGTARVLVETREGTRLWVERTQGSQPEVTDEAGRPVRQRLPLLEAYGQKEVEKHLAEVPARQLELLDRFAPDELEALRERLRALEAALATNGEEIDRHAAVLRGLEEETSRLPELARQLAEASNLKGELEQALAEKAVRERELQFLSRLERIEAGQREAVAAVRDQLGRALAPEPAQLAGSNGGILGEAQRAVAEGERELARLLDQAGTVLERTRAALAGQRSALEARHAVQEQRLRQVLATRQEIKGLAHERMALQRQVEELAQKERVRVERAGELEALRGARRTLLRQLSEVRDQRTAVRRRAAEELSQRLAPKIRISVEPGALREGYREVLDQALKDAEGKNVSALTRYAADGLLPDHLLRLVDEGNKEEIAHVCKTKPERAELFLTALGPGKKARWLVETCDLDDRARIELFHEEEWKEVKTLSSGLRCTTLVPLLLLEGERPLCLDQPEDDLSGQFLASEVVPRVREVKQRRQLIFVTHNSNLVVLGQAERISRMGLRPGGAGAQVAASGDSEQLKEQIGVLLEGGREAFLERKRVYGY